MADGDILVDSVLVLPAGPELGAGERTRRITTLHSGSRVTTKETTASRPADAARVFARIVYEDNAGSSHLRSRRRIPSRSAAAASAIPSTSASSRLLTCHANMPAFAAIPRPAVASSSI